MIPQHESAGFAIFLWDIAVQAFLQRCCNDAVPLTAISRETSRIFTGMRPVNILEVSTVVVLKQPNAHILECERLVAC